MKKIKKFLFIAFLLLVTLVSCREEKEDIIAASADGFKNANNYSVETISSVTVLGTTHTVSSHLTVFKSPYRAKLETDSMTLYIDKDGAYFKMNGQWFRILSTSNVYNTIYRILSKDGGTKMLGIIDKLDPPYATSDENTYSVAYVKLKYNAIGEYIENIYTDMGLSQKEVDAITESFDEESFLNITVRAGKDLKLKNLTVDLTDIMKLADKNIESASDTYNVTAIDTAESFVIPLEALTADIVG